MLKVHIVKLGMLMKSLAEVDTHHLVPLHYHFHPLLLVKILVGLSIRQVCDPLELHMFNLLE